MRPKAFLFDVFGTVVDWRSGVADFTKKILAHKNIDYDVHYFADLWRAQYQPAMQRIRSGNRDYVALDVIHRENLLLVLDDTGLLEHFSAKEITNFSRAWEFLPAWPDSLPGLHALKEKAIIAPCSNGSIAMLTHVSKHAALPWDCILGAEIAQNFKPEPEVYLKSVSALGLQPDEVVMVAAHNNDLIAAKKCGLKTAFFPRPAEFGPTQKTDLKAEDNWDFVCHNLEALGRKI